MGVLLGAIGREDDLWWFTFSINIKCENRQTEGWMERRGTNRLGSGDVLVHFDLEARAVALENVLGNLWLPPVPHTLAEHRAQVVHGAEVVEPLELVLDK